MPSPKSGNYHKKDDSIPPRTPSKAEVAVYTAELLKSLRGLSTQNGLEVLAQLLELARAEAVRIQQKPPLPD